MKKTWSEPSLEVLDVSKTMGGTDYKNFDSDFSNTNPIPVNDQGQPLIGQTS
ncbi:paeninodin family lasso peptide [Metabacillus litoralis]|uniref:paeninodin family lasso peptide n=1 Tax=Metabacillus litoralis TaxID=152268 RepID=UPI00203CAFC2|nr:paeninodin family lasso peptide [Metabacillus litoralis]MCM3161727.1 paeninodin family lasso peptide [Metabacillus litoralis]